MTLPYAEMERLLTDDDALAQGWEDPRWQVRYAAAIAMGETRDPRWLSALRRLMMIEDARELYSQPRVLGFVGSYDDTRMAEQLIVTEAIFDREYPDELLDAWRCRGRVRQACILAVHAIGSADDEWRELLHSLLHDPDEDFVVKTAAAKALSRVGTSASAPHLRHALSLDEWCLNVEARKALVALGERDA